MPDTKLRIGSLFSGIGGLDLAVEQFFDAETVWHSEFAAEPSKVLAARWPGVPNLGDVTTVDWSQVEPVDIMCGGFPCQDLSLAGRRQGMRPGTRSGLWSDFRAAVAILHPSVVIVENVRGLLSGCAESDSDVESCPGCLGISKQHRPLVRALGRVLGDLAALGFDAEWGSIRAADVGAPHGRFRVFVVAYAASFRLERGWPARGRGTGFTDGDSGRGGEPLKLLPTPIGSDGTGGSKNIGMSEFAPQLRDIVKLLPTPAALNRNDEEDLDKWLDRRARVKESAGNGNGFGVPLGVAVRLLPDVAGPVAWGKYEPAIRRWETLTRPVPPPTRPDGKDGRPRLNPLLPEWVMGYPDGWVTDIVDRNAAIKACGNGVLPHQAYAALDQLWPRVLDSLVGAA